MDTKEVLTLVALLVQAFEDGKLTGRELKQVLTAVIPDDLEVSFETLMSLLKHLGVGG
jgi:hypothetical protein